MTPPGRTRRSVWLAAVAAGSLALTACLGSATPAPSPPPPTTTTRPPTATTTTTTTTSTTTTTTTLPPPFACEAGETLSFESESPDATAYEAVVDDGTGGSEYVSFEAADGEELLGQITAIEATVGTVTAVAEQGEVGVLGEDPIDPNTNPRYADATQSPALQQARFDDAWAAGDHGAGVVVAVVDTGVRGDHEDLAANLLPGIDFVEDPGGLCVDPHGHGTHVAGIGGQVDNDVGGIGGAPRARILPVRVLGSDGRGTWPDVANGIEWAVQQGAKVINLSLSGATLDGEPPPTVEKAIGDAVDEGVTVIAAAGNCGAPNPDPDRCPQGQNTVVYPAALPNVIAVGALTTGTNDRASFSNDNDYVDIAAPGTSIDSTMPLSALRNDCDDLYCVLSGTSMSTSFVSAVAALILQSCPGMTPAGVRTTIQGSATVDVQEFVNATVKLLDAAAAAAADCVQKSGRMLKVGRPICR